MVTMNLLIVDGPQQWNNGIIDEPLATEERAMKKYFKTFGPFNYFKTKTNEGFSAWLKGWDNSPCGFEWGWKDTMRGEDRPVIDIRTGKLWLLYLEFFKKGGFEFHLLGFWWIR